MRIHKKILLLFWFLVLVSMTGSAYSARAESHSQIKLNPKRVPWLELLFRIETISADVTARVQLESLPAAEVEAALITNSEGVPIKVESPEAKRITVIYNVDYIFQSPVETINQVWFNPNDATALGRIRLRLGKDDFKKVYRFTEQGVFRHQLEPKDQQEASKPPEQWSNVQDNFYAYDLKQLGCTSVTERLLLIYIASAGELSDSMQPPSFCAFGRRQLFNVQLKPQGIQSLEVDYLEKKQQSEIRRRSKVEALKVALESKALASDLDDEEDFSFLGFQEDIALYIDPASGLPIQISGKIPVVGQVTIKLDEVLLR